MKIRSLLLGWLGALLFLAGVLLGLALSAAVVWVESEARVYSPFNADTSLTLHCPLMISPVESAVTSAEIMNLTDEEIKPVVAAEISHGKVPRDVRQTVVLAPGESTTVEWEIDSSDVVFEGLILVNVRQSQYSDNPSRSGSCGVLLFELFGLSGRQTFALIFTTSVILMLAGASLWVYTRWPLDQFSESLVKINSTLLVATLLALLSTLPRWWGLTIFFDVLILLISGIILTEFGLARDKYKTPS